jgi:cytochrome c553
VLACTACHGDQGRAGPDGYYPRLAGKPAGYLHHQLLNFRDGRRHYGLMTRMVDPLSDAYLLEIARIFRRWNCPIRRQRPSPPAACCAVARAGPHGRLAPAGLRSAPLTGAQHCGAAGPAATT